MRVMQHGFWTFMGFVAVFFVVCTANVHAQACDPDKFSKTAGAPMTFCTSDDYIFARGAFVEGTVSKFMNVLKESPKARIVFLQSGGGLADQGAQIGEIIRARGLDTSAFGVCASACLLAYLGGKERYKSKDARIGFHRAVAIVDMSEQERNRHLKELRLLLKVFFHSMGANPAALDPAWQRSIFNMYWYGDKEARKWKLSTAFKARQPAPPSRAFSANVASELSFKYTCELMTAYVKKWNSSFSKKHLDKFSKILWATTNCPEGRIRFRYEMKVDKSRMPKKLQARNAREIYCKDPILKEQMQFGWQVWMRMDFPKKKSQNIIVTCT